MDKPIPTVNFETATLGGGCYWCIEAVFKEINGVTTMSNGFSGGEEQNPTYEMACSGKTGHIEVVQIQFDPQTLPYQQLLTIFFAAHDPTQLNRQGNDVGPQYRSAIFYHSEPQRQIAQQMISTIDNNALYANKVVTEVRPATTFYPGPDYHQDYYNHSGSAPYCQIVIRPKVEKIRKLFADKFSL